MRNRYRANSEEACQSTNQNKSSQGNFRVDPRFEGVYTFPVDPVPRMNCSDEAAMDRIEKGVGTISLFTTLASCLPWVEGIGGGGRRYALAAIID